MLNHLVEEKLDAGDIIIQKKFPINEKDNFNTIVEKNYQVAAVAMSEALYNIENNVGTLIKNDNKFSNYNTTPTIKQAWIYRKRRILNKIRG